VVVNPYLIRNVRVAPFTSRVASAARRLRSHGQTRNYPPADRCYLGVRGEFSVLSKCMEQKCETGAQHCDYQPSS
jgi:hypothetical protein